MSTERLKKMLLIALSSTHGGEALAAITKVKLILEKDGHDIHWLVDRLTTAAVEPIPRDDPMRNTNPYGRTDTYHPRRPANFDANWVEALTTCHFWMPLGIYKPKEQNFLHSMSEQALEHGQRWRPSERQMEWLYDLWRRCNTHETQGPNR